MPDPPSRSIKSEFLQVNLGHGGFWFHFVLISYPVLETGTYSNFRISLAIVTYLETQACFTGGSPFLRTFGFRSCCGLRRARYSFCPVFAHKFCLFFTFQNIPQAPCNPSFHGNTAWFSPCVEHIKQSSLQRYC